MIDQRCLHELEKIIDSEVKKENKKKVEKIQELTIHMTLEEFCVKYLFDGKEKWNG